MESINEVGSANRVESQIGCKMLPFGIARGIARLCVSNTKLPRTILPSKCHQDDTGGRWHINRSKLSRETMHDYEIRIS
jgi:hypothetical protein